MTPKAFKDVVKVAVREVMNENDNEMSRVSIGGAIVLIALVAPWIMGFVLAKGFWSTFFCIFPPYAFYLVAEKFMMVYGVI